MDARFPLQRVGGFLQAGYDVPGYGGHLLPFRMDTVHSTGEGRLTRTAQAAVRI